MNQKRAIFAQSLTQILSQKWAHISASRRRFKNRLGAPKSNQMRGLSPKNEPIRPRGLGCRGSSVFEAFHLVYRSLL